MKFNELTLDSEALFAVFDHRLKIVFANKKFERIFTSTEMLSIHRTQALYILETRKALLTADYARNTNGRSHVALMSKRIVSNDDGDFVVFEGVLAADADVANIAAFGIPTQPSPQQLKLSDVDAQLMILMRHGYTVTQSAKILSVSQKAMMSRFERLSQKIGAKNKMEFIARINSISALQRIYSAVIKENTSFIISEKLPNDDGINNIY